MFHIIGEQSRRKDPTRTDSFTVAQSQGMSSVGFLSGQTMFLPQLTTGEEKGRERAGLQPQQAKAVVRTVHKEKRRNDLLRPAVPATSQVTLRGLNSVP